MRLTKFSDYAIRVLILAASRPERNITVEEAAAVYDISAAHLKKVVRALTQAGFLDGVRGPGGGYLLARTADQMRASDIILAVDEPIQTTRCSPGTPAGCHHNQGRCLTHDLWEELGNQIYLFLSSVTLEDICQRRVLGSSGLDLTANAARDAAQ